MLCAGTTCLLPLVGVVLRRRADQPRRERGRIENRALNQIAQTDPERLMAQRARQYSRLAMPTFGTIAFINGTALQLSGEHFLALQLFKVAAASAIHTRRRGLRSDGAAAGRHMASDVIKRGRTDAGQHDRRRRQAGRAGAAAEHLPVRHRLRPANRPGAVVGGSARSRTRRAWKSA